MSSKKDTLKPFANLQWSRVPGSEDYFDRADILRDRFARLAVIVVLMVLATPLLGIWVIRRARAPNPVIVYADGRVFSGPLTKGLNVSSDDIFRQMTDTVEVLLTRTEKGGVAALADFVGPGVIDVVNADFSPSLKLKSGYAQSYSITSWRILSSSPDWVVIGTRGLLSSRTLNGYQPSELFLAAGFVPGQKTDRNALGWRLVRLTPDPDGRLYFTKELAREQLDRLGIGK